MIPNSSSSQFNYLFGHLKLDVLICVQACSSSNQNLKEELKSMATQLAAAKEKVGNLSEEAGNYERSLQQTEGAFMEVVNRELALRNKLDDLEKQYTYICSERDSFKVGIGLCL